VSEKEPQEIVIIRRRASPEEGHHGGAWKIAFADFMTAMMALFLVLWLISSTSDKTKHTVAQYFNPVKLVDMTTLKKGFRDPKETEMGAGPSVKESEAEAPSRLAPVKGVNSTAGARPPMHSEAALFRDPYAVLAEIVADAQSEASKPESSAGSSPASESNDAAETFRDPFSTVPHAPEPKAQASSAAAHGKRPRAANATQDRVQPERPAALEVGDRTGASPTPAPDAKTPAAAAPHEAGAESSRANDAEAAKLKSEILDAVKMETRSQNAPRLEVQGTDEGILISLTDDLNYSMFAVGSAEPQPRTIEVMEKIGRLLKARGGLLVIRGHTDGRPYKSATYDNWRLSAARAHMAHYMLVRGGLDDKRLEKIEGYADRRLKFSNDPAAAGNRRIEILLRREKA
jgi:chemotaxis protein MotB